MRERLKDFVSAEQMLPLLDMPVPKVYPAKMRCPRCRTPRLHLFLDIYSRGHWHFCANCGTYGNMIALAKNVWKVDLSVVLQRLRQRGVELPDFLALPEAQAHYIQLQESQTGQLDHWLGAIAENLVQLADRCPNLLAQHTTLRDCINLACHTDLCGLFGMASTEALHAWLRSPTTHWTADRGRRKKQTHALVIPFYSLPGRMTGFYVQPDTVAQGYFQTASSLLTAELQLDPGLAMLSTLFQPLRHGNTVANTAFVLDDPLLAVRLQVKQLCGLQSLLRLTALLDIERLDIRLLHRTYTNLPVFLQFWHQLPSLPYVFCCRKLTPYILANAILADGHIYRYREPANQSLWLPTAQRQAVPWQQALQTIAKKFPAAKMGEFLDTLEQYLGDLECVRVAELLPARQLRSRLIRHKAQTIVEREDGWFISPSNLRICNAKLQTLAVQYDEDGSQTWKIRVQQCGHPALDLVCSNPQNIVQDLNRQLQQLRRPALYVAEAYLPQVLQIAQRFHAPEVQHVRRFCGWDRQQQQFTFPQFKICHDGSIDHSAILDATGLPGQRLTADEAVPNLQPLLCLDVQNEQFWTAFLLLAMHFADHLRGVPACGSLLNGKGGAAMVELFLHFGCNMEHSLFDPSQQALPRPEDANHAWPVVFSLTAHSQNRQQRWFTAPRPRNVVVNAPKGLVEVALCHAPWRVALTEHFCISERMIQTCRTLPVAWLRDVIAEQVRWQNNDAHVLSWTEQWLQRLDYDAEILQSARRRLKLHTCGPLGVLPHINQLLIAGIRRRRLVVHRQGYEALTPYPIVEMVAVDGIFLPQKTLQYAAGTNTVLDMEHLTQVFSSNGILLSHCREFDLWGWILKKDWWDTLARDLVQTHQRITAETVLDVPDG